jgi:alkylhydroperoxidase family enzyme
MGLEIEAGQIGTNSRQGAATEMMTMSSLIVALVAALAVADEGVAPVPPTRESMKEALEASKRATPRLPLPPLTEEEKELARQPVDFSKGRWGLVNNMRMRRHYLPAGVVMGGFNREPDPAMTLDNTFKTRLFWIVSRANNCTYCMGHQEVKLAADGMTEDQIAALDFDWVEFDPKERAAFGFARTLTFEPHRLGDGDVAALREAGYDEGQILEIVHAVAGFNAMNRWTGALRIPQEDHRDYQGPVAEKARGRRSLVAPLGEDGTAAPSRRPALETAAEVEAALSAARARTARIAPVEESAARVVLPNEPADAPLPQWVRLLARFPKHGPARVAMHRAAESEGVLDARTKAIIAYVAARYDRAWYALDLARRRLAELGLTPEEVAKLDALSRPWTAEERRLLTNGQTDQDGSRSEITADRVVATFARKLTTDPARIDDFDVETLKRWFEDREVAEIIFHVTEAAYFDRLTEAAGLPLER